MADSESSFFDKVKRDYINYVNDDESSLRVPRTKTVKGVEDIVYKDLSGIALVDRYKLVPTGYMWFASVPVPAEYLNHITAILRTEKSVGVDTYIVQRGPKNWLQHIGFSNDPEDY